MAKSDKRWSIECPRCDYASSVEVGARGHGAGGGVSVGDPWTVLAARITAHLRRVHELTAEQAESALWQETRWTRADDSDEMPAWSRSIARYLEEHGWDVPRIAEHFGLTRWEVRKRMANEQPHRRGAELTRAERTALRKRHGRGATYVKLAEEYGIALHAVRRICAATAR